jgi:hypothetical protein
MRVGLRAVERLKRSTWLLSIAALGGDPLVAQTIRPPTASAAGDTTPAPVQQSAVCFRDHPPPRCKLTILYAVGLHGPLLVSKVEYESPTFDGPNRIVRKETLDWYPAVSLGVLSNRDENHSLGVGAEVGDDRTAFHVVYRRWLEGGVALDVAPGVIRTAVTTPRVISSLGGVFVVADDVQRTGGTLGVDLHYRHWAIASVRADFVPGGPPQAVGGYVGVKWDGYWALAASAAAAIAAALVIGAIASSGY